MNFIAKASKLIYALRMRNCSKISLDSNGSNDHLSNEEFITERKVNGNYEIDKRNCLKNFSLKFLIKCSKIKFFKLRKIAWFSLEYPIFLKIFMWNCWNRHFRWNFREILLNFLPSLGLTDDTHWSTLSLGMEARDNIAEDIFRELNHRKLKTFQYFHKHFGKQQSVITFMKFRNYAQIWAFCIKFQLLALNSRFWITILKIHNKSFEKLIFMLRDFNREFA